MFNFLTKIENNQILDFKNIYCYLSFFILFIQTFVYFPLKLPYFLGENDTQKGGEMFLEKYTPL